MQFPAAADTSAVDVQSIWDHTVTLAGVLQLGYFNFPVCKWWFWKGRLALYGKL